MGNVGEQRMPIEGMTCQHCAGSVGEALPRVGATDVRVDHRRGEAVFNTLDDTGPGVFAGAVKAASYQPGMPEPLPQASGDGLASTHVDFDLAIVGSGAAAFAAAIRGRELGARVVMVERGTLGGTCVNVGCVPSKTLLRASELHYQAGHHPFAGVATLATAVDLALLVDQKDGLVRALRREKYEDLDAAYGWDVIRGEARFVDGDRLQVGRDTIVARHFLIATGASPAIPRIPGLAGAGYLTSTTAMDLRHVPDSIVVIGSGYVALELGQLFRHLGTSVTLVQRSPRLLKDYEPEVAAAVHEALSAQGIGFVTGAHFLQAEGGGSGHRVSIEVDGEIRLLEAEQLLVAAGRHPNTAALQLDRAGVAVGDRGEVVLDEYLRTTNPRVFAAGDVTLGPQFVYVAAYEGVLAAGNALTGAQRKIDLRTVPAVVFTNPSIATVGLTEAQAIASGRRVKTAILPAKVVPRALVNRESYGVFKLVADADTDRLLGAHVVAENAGEVIYAAALAVKFNLTVQDLVDTFAPYLTMAEGLKLAAQAFTKDVGRLSCCAS